MPKVEPIASGSARAGGRRARAARVSSSLAEINVVPLVDVMLVLLVIFMVAAPMMQQGFPVDLPQSRRAQALEQEPVTVTVPTTFRKDGQVRLGDEAVPLAVLPERIRQVLDARTDKSVMFAGDADVTYGDLVTVWDRLMDAGVANLKLQTQPPRRRQP